MMNSYVRYMLKSNYCIKLKLYTVADPSSPTAPSLIIVSSRKVHLLEATDVSVLAI